MGLGVEERVHLCKATESPCIVVAEEIPGVAVQRGVGFRVGKEDQDGAQSGLQGPHGAPCGLENI